MENTVAGVEILLTDRDFTVKAQFDPDFRQALVLDPDGALTYFSISLDMRKKMKSILRVLDHMLLILSRNRTLDEYLRRILSYTETRRVLLFAPCQASSMFGLHSKAVEELLQLSSMAGIIFETLLIDWEIKPFNEYTG